MNTITVIIASEALNYTGSASASTDEDNVELVWEAAMAALQGAMLSFGFSASHIAELMAVDQPTNG